MATIPSQATLLQRLQDVFREVLDNDSFTIAADTTQAATPTWDSLAQVSLVMAIEREFDVYFTAREVSDLVSIQAILTLLESKLAAA